MIAGGGEVKVSEIYFRVKSIVVTRAGENDIFCVDNH